MCNTEKGVGGMMTKQESLNILASAYERMKSMTEDALFHHFMRHSESFRKDAADFKNTVELTGQDCSGFYWDSPFRIVK